MSGRRGGWHRSSYGPVRGGSSSYLRGHTTGFDPSRPSRQKVEPPRPPSPPLGAVLATLREDELANSPDLYEYPAKIIGCKDVASYNWLNKTEPTILVPGKPPAWTPLATPKRLKEDSGNYFRDRNAARYPAHPIEPAVQAILTSQPDFPTSSVDIFACGSTLGNLLRFVRKVDKPFRMLVEAIGDTVFLVRRENSPTELIPNVKGFGHTFPEEYTTWEADVKTSESHQRIVGYVFGGLDCLVRFEADGYHRDLVPGGLEVGGGLAPAERVSCDDMLASALDESTIAARPCAQDKPLTVTRGGQRIPQSSSFDLKTRSIRKKDEDILADELPRLWVSQIPNFILAYHASGVFEEIQTRNVRHEIEGWERENEDTLRRFVVLLRKIVAFARGRQDRKFEILHQEVDVLELREQGGEVGDTLSATVEARWVAGEGESDGPDSRSHALQGPDARYLSESDDENATFDWDEASEKDFTACSAEHCGYCGHCTY